MTHWLKDAPPWLIFGASVTFSVALNWVLLMAIVKGYDREIDFLRSQVHENTNKIVWHVTQQPHSPPPTLEKP